MKRPNPDEIRKVQQEVGDAIYQLVGSIKETEIVHGITVPDIHVVGPEWSIDIRRTPKQHDPKIPVGEFG